jgi:hypothetical protein
MTGPASPPLPTMPNPDGRHPHFRSYDPPPIADDALERQRRHVTPIRNPSPSLGRSLLRTAGAPQSRPVVSSPQVSRFNR